MRATSRLSKSTTLYRLRPYATRRGSRQPVILHFAVISYAVSTPLAAALLLRRH